VPTAWGSGTWGSGAWGGLGETLTGDDARGAVGNVTGNLTVALTGVAATGTPGSIAVNGRNIALTGVAASGNVGSVTETNSPTEGANFAL